MRPLLTSGLLLLATLPLCAQQQPLHITPDTPASTEALGSWLHSDDPYLIAWAATLARRDHNAAVLVEMPAALDSWSTPLLGLNDKSRATWTHAVNAILDALIQENVSVPPNTIRNFAGSFPSQAIILIARLPLLEATPTLQSWAYSITPGEPWNQRLLARLATMMLAAGPHPTNEIVNSVISQSELDLKITIAATGGDGGGYGIRPGCGDSISSKPLSESPEVYNYDLEENTYSGTSPTVFDLDGDRITYSRFKVNHPLGSCNGVEQLDAVTRHRILAHWLGTPLRDMPWWPQDEATILWKGKANYKAQLASLIEDRRAKLAATVAKLRQKQILTSELGFAPISPRLVITITCNISPCPLDNSAVNSSHFGP